MIVAIDASRAEVKEKTGVEYYSYFLIKQLISVIPREVKVILYSRVSLKFIFGKLPNNWENKVLNWPVKFFWSQWRLARQVNKDRPDIFWVPSHILPFLVKVKSAVTVHDISWLKMPAAYSLKSRWYLRLTTWWGVNHARAVITISNYSKEQINQHYPRSANKIFTTYLGPVITSIAQPVADVDHPFFMFLGRVETKKNLLVILKAFSTLLKQYPQYQLLLVGKAGRGAAEVQALIKELKLADNVKQISWLPEAQVAWLLNKTTALIFPGAAEGFGLPVLDAWVHGAPVIAANAGALPEVVADAGLLVESDNSSDWQTKLNLLISNKDIRQNLVSKGSTRLKLFSWQQTVEKTWQVLQMAAAEN